MNHYERLVTSTPNESFLLISNIEKEWIKPKNKYHTLWMNQSTELVTSLMNESNDKISNSVNEWIRNEY